MSKKITVAQVIEALKKTGGLISPAANMLGVTRQSIYGRIKASKRIQTAKFDAEEATLDLAEMKLITNIRDGDNASIFFYLKCKGKERGYIEKGQLEITGADGGPIKIEDNNDLSKLNKEELYELRELLKKTAKSANG